MTTQPTALNTYLLRLPMILDKSAGGRFGRTQCARRVRAMDGEHHKIEALRQLADDHFGHHLDAIHWGLVGDLGRVDQALDDLLAIFDGEAE